MKNKWGMNEIIGQNDILSGPFYFFKNIQHHRRVLKMYRVGDQLVPIS